MYRYDAMLETTSDEANKHGITYVKELSHEWQKSMGSTWERYFAVALVNDDGMQPEIVKNFVGEDTTTVVFDEDGTVVIGGQMQVSD